MNLKTELVKLYSRQDILPCDLEQLEYLIGLVDFVLMGDLKLDKEIIESLMEEIIATSVVQIQFGLLKFLKPLCELIYEEAR